MSAEGAVTMVVLSVNVTGDGTANGDEARAGHDWQEPATRHKGSQNVIQRNTCSAGKHTRLRIKVMKLIQIAC